MASEPIVTRAAADDSSTQLDPCTVTWLDYRSHTDLRNDDNDDDALTVLLALWLASLICFGDPTARLALDDVVWRFQIAQSGVFAVFTTATLLIVNRQFGLYGLRRKQKPWHEHPSNHTGFARHRAAVMRLHVRHAQYGSLVRNRCLSHWFSRQRTCCVSRGQPGVTSFTPDTGGEKEGKMF